MGQWVTGNSASGGPAGAPSVVCNFFITECPAYGEAGPFTVEAELVGTGAWGVYYHFACGAYTPDETQVAGGFDARSPAPMQRQVIVSYTSTSRPVGRVVATFYGQTLIYLPDGHPDTRPPGRGTVAAVQDTPRGLVVEGTGTPGETVAVTRTDPDGTQTTEDVPVGDDGTYTYTDPAAPTEWPADADGTPATVCYRTTTPAGEATELCVPIPAPPLLPGPGPSPLTALLSASLREDGTARANVVVATGRASGADTAAPTATADAIPAGHARLEYRLNPPGETAADMAAWAQAELESRSAAPAYLDVEVTRPATAVPGVGDELDVRLDKPPFYGYDRSLTVRTVAVTPDTVTLGLVEQRGAPDRPTLAGLVRSLRKGAGQTTVIVTGGGGDGGPTTPTLTYEQVVRASDPAWFLAFDDPDDPAKDTSGRGRALTNRSVTTAAVTGHGTVGRFAGNDILVPVADWMNVSAWSLEAILGPVSGPGIMRHILDRHVDGAGAYQLRVGGDDELQFIPFASDQYTIVSTPLAWNAWSHVVVTTTGTESRIYVNGQLRTTRTHSPSNLSNSYGQQIGSSAEGAGPFGTKRNAWPTDMASIAWYPATLSAADVTAHYAALTT